MNKRRIIASLIVVCVFAGIALFVFRSREPVYQERPLSAWLEDLDYGQPSFRREAVPQAEEAVRQIGTNAVPFLVGMMRCKDSPFRKKMIALCSKQSFIKFPFRPPADTLQWRGALGIYSLGPVGKAAIPELINLLTNQHTWIRGRAAMALGKIGPDAAVAVPHLINALADKDEDVRACTCAGLSDLGPAGAGALPAVVECMKETNHTVFSMALAAASNMRVQATLIVPVLAAKLTDNDSRIRYSAATTLASYGSEARTAVPRLVEALKDPDKDVRQASAEALMKIDRVAAADAGVNVAADPPPKRAEANFNFNFHSAPVSQVLELYMVVSGAELVMEADPRHLTGSVTLHPTRPLTGAETVQALEKGLSEQAGTNPPSPKPHFVRISSKYFMSEPHCASIVTFSLVASPAENFCT